MNVYLDSSVVLGRLQGERAPTIPWARWEHAYSSVLLRAEVLRTIDRSRLRQALTDQGVSHCPWHTGRLASGNGVAFTRDRRNRNDIPYPRCRVGRGCAQHEFSGGRIATMTPI